MSTSVGGYTCLVLRHSPLLDVLTDQIAPSGGTPDFSFKYVDQINLGAEDKVTQLLSSLKPDLVLDHFAWGGPNTNEDTTARAIVDNCALVSTVARVTERLGIRYLYCSHVQPTMSKEAKPVRELEYGSSSEDPFTSGLMYAEQRVLTLNPMARVVRVARLFGPGDHDLHDLLARELGYAALLDDRPLLELNNDVRMNWAATPYASFLLSMLLPAAMVTREGSRIIHLGCALPQSEYEVAKSALRYICGGELVEGHLRIAPVNSKGVREAVSLGKVHSSMDLGTFWFFTGFSPTTATESIEEAVLVDGFLDPQSWLPWVEPINVSLSQVKVRRGV